MQSDNELRDQDQSKSADFTLFFVFWLVLGLFVNSDDQRNFSLQQAGVEALVSHGTFALDDVENPRLKPLGDVFEFGGRVYAAKQPGQFVLGAMPYGALKVFGITYDSDFELAASLVTFFSATFFAAGAAFVLFLLLRDVYLFDSFSSLGTAVLFMFGTTAFPYSGIAHHDSLATSLLIVGLYFFERRKDWGRGAIIAGGFAAGLSVFCSMLAVFMLVAISGYSLVSGGARKGILFLGGALLGSAPLLFYNWMTFGGPLIPANIAGDFSDTYPLLSPSNFLGKLNTYFGVGDLSLIKYAPLVLIGGAGLMMRERLPRPLVASMLCGVAIHSLYVSNIETVGHCQFGPRYLLPAMPFLTLGLAEIFQARRESGTQFVFFLFLLFAGLISVAINAIGALGGAMYCDISRYAVPVYLERSDLTDISRFSLMPWCFAGLVVLGISVFQRSRS